MRKTEPQKAYKKDILVRDESRRKFTYNKYNVIVKNEAKPLCQKAFLTYLVLILFEVSSLCVLNIMLPSEVMFYIACLHTTTECNTIADDST